MSTQNDSKPIIPKRTKLSQSERDAMISNMFPQGDIEATKANPREIFTSLKRGLGNDEVFLRLSAKLETNNESLREAIEELEAHIHDKYSFEIRSLLARYKFAHNLF